MQVTQKLKLKPATPILEFGIAKVNWFPWTVKVSVNTLASEKGLVKKSVCCEHGDRMDEFASAQQQA
jgi:hypothetical protein